MTREGQGRGWLSKVAPGFHRLIRPRPTPGELWVRIEETGEVVYRPDLEAAQFVTPSGFHVRIGPTQRFGYLFDRGAFDELPAPPTPDDPLAFTFSKNYRQSLATARRATGDSDAMRAGVGRIDGATAVVAVQNFAFIAGSLSVAVGETFVAAAGKALELRAPLIVFTAAAGARMQESTLALMQMARTTVMVEQLRAAGLPYIVVLTDPTIGGVTASYAMLGDVQLAERGAVVGFTGRRVIKQTIGETLPDEYQTAEFLAERGVIDRVVTRADLPKVLGALIRTLTPEQPRLSAA